MLDQAEDVRALKEKVNMLEEQNELYVKTINALSTELLSRRKRPSELVGESQNKQMRIADDHMTIDMPAPLIKKLKDSPKGTHFDTINLPKEIFVVLFKYLRRDDLDRCKRVCKQWNALINEHSRNLPHRNISLLKLIDKNQISLEAKTAHHKKKYSFFVEEYDRNNEFYAKLKSLLKNSIVKRLIICNLTFTDEFVRRLRELFRNQPIQITRLEILAVNLMRISPDIFHRLLGQVLIARQYFVDGVRGASEDHFSGTLFDQKGVKEADDFTVYDVRSVDNDEISLELGDDVLLELIFGMPDLPERNSLYLDSPEVTSNFLDECLKRFVDAETIDRMLTHVEFAHCREQHVPTHRDITLEYEHPIQIEWSAVNKRTGRILEARISRNGDGDNFCHLTLNLQSGSS